MKTQKIFQLISFSFLSFLSFFNIMQQAKAQVSVSDSLELVNFYYATGGDDWYYNDGWLVEPVSEWHGITLNDAGTSVQTIEMNSNNLEGTILNLNLPNLRELNFRRNKLTGNIPYFSNLPNLTKLILYNN